MTEIQKTADADHDGVMVALLPPKDVSEKLHALPQATEPVEDGHITLLYLGSTEDAGGEDGHDRLTAAIYTFVTNYAQALKARINGFGVFTGGEQDVLVALWDAPGLPRFRDQFLGCCRLHSVPRREENHGFTAHQTLAYSDEPLTKIPDKVDVGEVLLDTLVLSWGKDWREFKLPG